MTAGYTESIAELLRQRLSEQVRNVDRLRSLSQRERELLVKRDLDRVAEQEGKKQQLLETIRQRDREIDVLRQVWDREKENFRPEARREIESLLRQLGEQMRQVMEIEGDNVTIVQRLRDEVETELRKLIGMRKSSGYGQSAEPEGRFLDTHA